MPLLINLDSLKVFMLINTLKRFGHIEPKLSGFHCVFLNYSENHFKKHPQRDFLQIAAFDPGIVNTGCRIERRQMKPDLSGFSKVETVHQALYESAIKVPKPKKPKGKPAAKGRRRKRAPRERPEMTKNQHYYMTMARHIYAIRRELRECDYILLESQLYKKNPEASRFLQHLISTIIAVSCDFGLLDSDGVSCQRPLIVEIDPSFKTRSFGVRKHDGLDIKKWATIKGFDLLEQNKDTKGKQMMKDEPKRDDLGDVILYCEAWSNVVLNHINGCDEIVLMEYSSDEESESSDSD